ncbi:monovalent cation/H+ antiporter complex subunit F [Kribbella sp. NPDC059898]|uniref:monovalent cation/H+ antiporter complex subunit F n=1 Tax=Kribbella sp. NPDC059898 TaxID=3346995 RepID=UPI00365E280A
MALMFFAAYADRTPYLDVALWMASFGHLGTLVWARFLERGCTSKVITMGALPALLAVAVSKGIFSPYGGVRVLMVAFLILVLNPAASHALARAAYKTGIRQWRGAVADEPHDRGGQ